MRSQCAAMLLVYAIAVTGSNSFAQPLPPGYESNPDFKKGLEAERRAMNTRPAFEGAAERWTCAFRDYLGGTSVMYLGAYPGYAKTQFASTIPIIGNTPGALILADSTFGDKDLTGTSIKQLFRVIIINRNDFTFRMIFADDPGATTTVEKGQCSKDG